MWFFSLMLVLSSMSSLLAAAPFYGQHEEGWFWYQKGKPDSQFKKDSLDKNPPSLSPPPPPNLLSAQDKIKQIQETLEEATARAILHPTLPHVQEVMKLQRQILERSTLFQERWMQASLFESQHTRPEDNTTPLHRKLLQEKKQQELQQKIRRLAKETGLFFVFQQSCSHCHAFAPIVKEFAKDYGFDVKAISKDGGTLTDFPDVSRDNGMIARINTEGIYPALFLAHPASGQVIPIAWGMTTPTQLLENVATIIKALEGRTFHAP